MTTTLQEQINALTECGIVLNDGVDIEKELQFNSIEAIQEKPFNHLIEELAWEKDGDISTPKVNSLWMCDVERVEDHGAYSSILQRLETLTGCALNLENIRDYVDVEEKKAWVEFSLKGKTKKWNMTVDDDWMDPLVIVKYDRLLKKAKKEKRILINTTDYGQCMLVAGMNNTQVDSFEKLSPVDLIRVDSLTFFGMRIVLSIVRKFY